MSLWVLWCGLLPLAMIDAKHMLLPDCLTQPLLWAGLLNHALFIPYRCRMPCLAQRRATCRCGFYWAFRLTTGREGLGYGDFKLLAALGAWCGWQALPSLLLAAALSGIALYFVFIKRLKKIALFRLALCCHSPVWLFLFCRPCNSHSDLRGQVFEIFSLRE